MLWQHSFQALYKEQHTPAGTGRAGDGWSGIGQQQVEWLRPGIGDASAVLSHFPGVICWHWSAWTCTSYFSVMDPSRSATQAGAFSRLRGQMLRDFPPGIRHSPPWCRCIRRGEILLRLGYKTERASIPIWSNSQLKQSRTEIQGWPGGPF